MLESGPKRPVITSSHEVVLVGTPVRIDRYAIFQAGDGFFHPRSRHKKYGSVGDLLLLYVWRRAPVGDYGASIGDVGWVKDRVFR